MSEGFMMLGERTGNGRSRLVFINQSLATSMSPTPSSVIAYKFANHFTTISQTRLLMDSPIAAPFSAQEHLDDNKVHILLAASGSVASIKLPNIAEALCRHRTVSIRIIVTQSAEQFLTGQSSEQPTLDSIRQIDGVDGIYRDEDEWSTPWTRGEPILHIELRKVRFYA